MAVAPLGPQGLIERVLAGEPLALARAMSWVEELDEHADALLAALFPRLGNAWRVGVAGPPGAGKSTLCCQLARSWRGRGLRVGVVAVDPSSPLSGGALLGDRIRFRDLATDPGVFIRSLASRGSLGGLSLAAGRVADVLDAAGFDVVLLETVGMGQVGEDVRDEADTTVVMLVPESGDGVQAMKAGLLELADVLVVNKMDRPGGADLLRQLALAGARAGRPAAGESQGAAPAWEVPLLGTSATSGEGLGPLSDALENHRQWLRRTHGGRAEDDVFWRRRFLRLAETMLVRNFRRRLAADAALAGTLEAVRRGERALGPLLAEILERHGGGPVAPSS